MNVRSWTMINAEKFKKELRNVNRDTVMFERWGIDKRTNAFIPCGCIYCKNCVMNDIRKEENERKNYVGCNHARMKWLLSEYKEPIVLTELEYKILKFIADNTKHMYIARDKQGTLYLYDFEPRKSNVNEWWIGKGATPLTPFNKLFRFVIWENENACSIKGILKHCEVENCMVVR